MLEADLHRSDYVPFQAHYVGALPRPDIFNPDLSGVKLLKIVPKGDKYITPTCRGTPLVLSNQQK